MRSSAKKQIQSLGVVLPFDAGASVPFTLTPILFKNDSIGNYLREQLSLSSQFSRFDDESLQQANLTFPQNVILDLREFSECTFDLVFIRRNYDGTEVFYLVHQIHPKYYSKFAETISKTKGGMIL